MVQEIFDWVFSSHVFEVGAVFAFGIGVTLALAQSRRDIRLAHWFFAAGFLLTMGRTAQFVVTLESQSMKYVSAFLLFGVVGLLWVASHTWVMGKHQDALPSKAEPPPVVPAYPPKDKEPTPHKPKAAPPAEATQMCSDEDGFRCSIKSNGTTAEGVRQRIVLGITAIKTLESPVIRIKCSAPCRYERSRLMLAGADQMPVKLDVDSHYPNSWINIKFIDQPFEAGRTLDVFITADSKFTITTVKLLHAER
jgi:hypothetical protein